MTNVLINLNNGTSLETANGPITVSFSTGYRFQYTAENNKVFMTFTASVPANSKKQPAFGLQIKLRQFDIRPPKPVDPVDPVDPVIPPVVDPVKPPIVDPTKPVDPTTPVDPTKPIIP